MKVHTHHAVHITLRLFALLFCLAEGVSGEPAAAQTTIPATGPSAWHSLGGASFQNWTGLVAMKNSDEARLSVPGRAVYQVPDGPRGVYPVGLSTASDSTLDLKPWYGLRFDIRLEKETPLRLRFTLAVPPQTGRRNIPDSCSAELRVQGTGWQTVTVPFTAFDYYRQQIAVLRAVKQITLQANYDSPMAKGQIAVRNVRLVRGNLLHLQSGIRSLPAEGDGTASYPVTVTNASNRAQLVQLTLRQSGFEGMTSRVLPPELSLRPGQSKTATVTVTVPSRLPRGAQETQTLVATPSGDSTLSESLDFITLRRLPFPYLVHSGEEWNAVRANAERYDWGKKAKAEIVATADAYRVPEVPPGGMKSDSGTPAVFKSYSERQLWACAFAWKLTGDKRYAEKAALFLRRLSDPLTGFPKTLHANSQGIPQEGGMLEGCARAYDAIQDAGVLTDADRHQIEQTFRLYIGLQLDGLAGGGISNWTVFNLCPAAECALVVQDMVSFNALLNDPGGIIDHLRYGTMDDGWWYEMSLSYNLGCAEAFTNLGLAARPFGIDLLHAPFPASLTQKVGLRPFEYENLLGMAFGKFGPLTSNTVSIKKMWDGIVLYPDYRGVMFGMGDGHEQAVAGGQFEQAYFAYRDPAYAAIIKQGARRDLLYGVPDLPADTPKNYALSGHSDNAGIAVLRSQTASRPPREQIQVSFKYGTHGSYHGHFDRLSLNSLMRYGRSFWNPETSWYGYGSYMYKWWVQPSVSHNMVVVDGKQQEPQECVPLLFHSGPMLQAVAAETTARWSNPPYFGGYEQIEGVKTGDINYVRLPASPPAPGSLSGYTEPIRQRRLILVTDDYVVLADDLQGTKEHQFDSLLHLRGAALADPVQPAGHSPQFDADPLSSGQFITNVNRYALATPAVIHSTHRVAGTDAAGKEYKGANWETGGAKSLSEPGFLHLDARVLWPLRADVAIGDYAESWWGTNKKLTYAVLGDDKPLAAGTFGAWNLGKGEIDVPVGGLRTLVLTTRVRRGRDNQKNIFWGDALLVTADGKEIPLSTLPVSTTNVAANTAAAEGKDYAGGPIRIAGIPVSRATPAEPQNADADAVIQIDLAGLNAVRFKAVVGADWPVGDEEQLRKTVAVRSMGKTARFLTLIEPYESDRRIKSALATGPDHLTVTLADGRVQEITVVNIDRKTGAVRVEIVEKRNGRIVRSESTDRVSAPP